MIELTKVFQNADTRDIAFEALRQAELALNKWEAPRRIAQLGREEMVVLSTGVELMFPENVR